jgi:ATP-dependent protease ClpP protease subunit
MTTPAPVHWRFVNQAAPQAELFIDDDIGAGGVTPRDFGAALRRVRSKRLLVHVHSGGGNLLDALAIHDALRQWEGVTTSRVTLAASGASLVALGASRVQVTPNASMMIHRATISSIGGNTDDLASVAAQLAGFDRAIAAIYRAKAGGELDEWQARMAKETWYHGIECVDAGLADEIVDGDRVRVTATLGDLITAGLEGYRREQRALIPEMVRASLREACTR